MIYEIGNIGLVTGYRLQVTGYRSQVTGHRLQVTGYRSQVAGCRLQVAGCRFKTWHRDKPGAVYGFTLVEMLVVLAIIGMIMAISIPFTSSFGKGLKIKTATRAVGGIINVAKSNAMTFRKNYSAVFDVKKSQYWIEDDTGRLYEKKYLLPGSVSFRVKGDDKADPVTFENDRITFNASGSAGGVSGLVILTDKQGDSRTISVAGATGKITVN